MIVKAFAVAVLATTAGTGAAQAATAKPAAATAAKPRPGPEAGSKTILYGPVPAWVKPAALPPTPPVEPGAPYGLRLSDEQAWFSPDGDHLYTEIAFQIMSEDGLDAGSLTQEWDPATETVTIHRLNVIRDGQVIDVLKSDKFEILRRETNLESAMLDGRLTAVLQVKDLRVGDSLDFAVTRIYRDPLAGGRPEWRSSVDHAGVAGRVRYRALWAKDRPMRWRKGSDLATPTVAATSAGEQELTLDLVDIKAPVAPTGAPMRYAGVGALSLSGFEDWGQVSALMAPLYRQAAVLEAGSPLRAEAAKIKAASPDPAARAALALKLVQSQVRYVFVGLDGNGRKPAAADDTWRHRFGDCKGKTALLLALLAELDIDAEPALVNSSGRGDGLDERLPGLDMFDHVIARAAIGGRVYWLDGTRSGDEALANIETPPFRWALPLRAAGGALEKLDRQPAARPYGETVMQIDASAGADAPAEVTVQAVLRGDQAIEANRAIVGKPRDEVSRASLRAWSNQLSWVQFTDIDWTYDAEAALFSATVRGKGKIHWWPVAGGRRQWDIDGSGVSFGTFERDSAQDAKAPYGLSFPAYGRWVTTILLPNKGEGFEVNGRTLDETVGGVRVRRWYGRQDGQVAMTRSLRVMAPEITAAEAQAATERARSDQSGVIAVQTLDPAAKDPIPFKPRDAKPGPLMAGYEALVAGREDEALRLFQRARDAKPAEDDAWIAMINLLSQRRDYDRALALCDQAARKSASKPEVWTAHRADVLVDAGRAEAAEAELTKALQAAPDNARLLVALAEVHAAQKKLDLAGQDLDRAVAAAPDDVQVLRRRAGHALTIKAYDDAIARYEAILARDPDDAYGVIGVAEAYNAAKRPKEALREADAAVRLDPLDANVLTWRSNLHLENKRYAAALADAERVIALRPDEAQSWNSRCWVRAVWGEQLDKALADCDASLKIRPRSAPVLDSRGMVRFRQGQLQAALQDYDAALALSPKQAASLYGRGLVKLKLGQQAAGQADLAAATAIDAGIKDRFDGYGLAAN